MSITQHLVCFNQSYNQANNWLIIMCHLVTFTFFCIIVYVCLFVCRICIYSLYLLCVCVQYVCIFVCMSLWEMFTAGLSVWHLFRLRSGLFHGVLGETSQTQTQFVKQICFFSLKRELFAALCIWSLSGMGDGLHQACRLIKTTWV